VFDICGMEPNWSPQSFIDETVANVRKTVGTGRVICGLSGGVDSSVAAELVHRAVGDQLTCIFVNNGVLRKNDERLEFALQTMACVEDLLNHPEEAQRWRDKAEQSVAIRTGDVKKAYDLQAGDWVSFTVQGQKGTVQITVDADDASGDRDDAVGDGDGQRV